MEETALIHTESGNIREREREKERERRRERDGRERWKRWRERERERKMESMRMDREINMTYLRGYYSGYNMRAKLACL